MIDFLRSIFAEPWKPVSRPVAAAWIAFYFLFLGYAFSAHGGFLFIDSANLVVHEGGHNLFGWFGPTLGLWGGTLLQWLVPFLLALYFFGQRQTTGFTFCLFFFFENWLYTATYMADARSQGLPLVTTGDPDFVEHDWHTIFSSLGVLNYDTKIGAVVRFLGWCGMIAVTCWLATRAWAKDVSKEQTFDPLQELILNRQLEAARRKSLASQQSQTNNPPPAPTTAPNPR